MVAYCQAPNVMCLCTVGSMSREPTSLQQLVAQNAKRLREDRRLSQDDVAVRARRFGVPWRQATVANLENGRKVPTVETLVVLAAALSDASEGAPLTLGALAGGDVDIALGGDVAVPAQRLAEFLEGVPVELERIPSDADGAPVELAAGPLPDPEEVERVRHSWKQADARAARRIGVDDATAQALMARTLGSPLSEYSEHMVGSGASAQAKGIVTRGATFMLSADHQLSRAIAQGAPECVEDSRSLKDDVWSALARELQRLAMAESVDRSMQLAQDATYRHRERLWGIASTPWLTDDVLRRILEAWRGDGQ